MSGQLPDIYRMMNTDKSSLKRSTTGLYVYCFLILYKLTTGLLGYFFQSLQDNEDEQGSHQTDRNQYTPNYS